VGEDAEMPIDGKLLGDDFVLNAGEVDRGGSVPQLTAKKDVPAI